MQGVQKWKQLVLMVEVGVVLVQLFGLGVLSWGVVVVVMGLVNGRV